MNREEILKNIEQIFKENFDNEELMINEETSINDIEEWDSFEYINLLVSIEGYFNIKIDITEVPNLKNVSSIVDLIESKLI